MRIRSIALPAVLAVLLIGMAAAGYITRGAWLPWLAPAAPEKHADGDRAHASAAGETQQVRLTPQAQSNLRLVAKPLKPETYWRTIPVPGTIVDRPAHSDRGVVAPMTGVIAKVHAFPGDTVRTGDPLFTLRLLSESFLLTQTDLFKAYQEIQIGREQKKRYAEAGTAVVSEAKTIEVENQLRRLSTAVQAYRLDLQTRGLTAEQIDGVAAGRFVTEFEVKAPIARGLEQKPAAGPTASSNLSFPTGELSANLEVQELRVELGQQVQAGQTLGLLSDHRSLYIEGRAFRPETALVERTAKEDWPVQIEFMEAAGDWPALEQPFTIRHIANTIDLSSRTFAFYLALVNQARSFEKDGKTFLLWRFRPGQKVRLHIRVERFDNVFVLPADAVVRDGPEAYVFRQNGDLFDRKPVRIVFQDRQHVVIANDGSVPAGLYVAQGGATQLNRVLKAQGSTPAGFHVHADGSVHANH